MQNLRFNNKSHDRASNRFVLRPGRLYVNTSVSLGLTHRVDLHTQAPRQSLRIFDEKNAFCLEEECIRDHSGELVDEPRANYILAVF